VNDGGSMMPQPMRLSIFRGILDYWAIHGPGYVVAGFTPPTPAAIVAARRFLDERERSGTVPAFGNAEDGGMVFESRCGDCLERVVVDASGAVTMPAHEWSNQ